ncbi:beta strand repeat-containing protein, partial [Chitinophaga solisilvae]|uniref:beta strand repeat-containing protein n=1 Tax=Chitinophaga solisilvae TaxID=1233460 RepID=UPI0019235FC2
MKLFLQFPFLFLFLTVTLTLHGEGSKELSQNGGSRAFWRSSTVTTATFPIPSLVTVKVYARAGEKLYMGSSAQGIGQGTINWVAPDGTTGSSGSDLTTGLIASRAEEVAGPRVNPADPGYLPYIVPVQEAQEGIWLITFMPTNTQVAGGNAPVIAANANWVQNPNSWYISAVDVSVRDIANSSFIPGRAYMNIFTGNTSNVGQNYGSFNGIFYILTNDGYRYAVNANGMQGAAFYFFVNNNGFLDNNGKALYKSVADIGSTLSTIPVHNPTQPDDATNITHKLFFNPVASDLPASARSAENPSEWLLRTPLVRTLSDLTWTGIEGTPDVMGTTPLGGNFTFTTNVSGAFQIGLDLNNNGEDSDPEDKLLTGFANVGTNTVYWDGRTNNGTPAAAATINGARITVELHGGEVHFPLLDVEKNPSGIIVTQLNGSSGDTLYWDDSDIPLIGVPSSPVRNLTGQSSSVNGHKWTDNFGDNNGMDSWSYIASAPLTGKVNLILREADLEVAAIIPDKTGVCLNGRISYQVTVRNNGPSDVSGSKFRFTFPSYLTGITVTHTVTTGTATVTGETTGSGAYDATLDMNNGALITFTVGGTVTGLPPGGQLNTNASILRPADVTDPDATNPDATPPADPAAECDALPSGSGCNNMKYDTLTVYNQLGNNTISAYQQVCAGSVPDTLRGGLPTGGSGIYTYLWESSTTDSLNNFSAAAGISGGQHYIPGTASVRTWYRRVVTAGCSSTSNIISVAVLPLPDTPKVTVTQPICTNANGTITITAPLGESLTYSIDGTNYQQAATFTAISGSYQVTVKNTDGCVSAATNAVVNPQPQTPAAPTVNITQPTCTNANGTIIITAPLGESLTYSIDGTNYQQAATFTAASGSYQVTLKNADGCVSAATNAVVNPQPQTPAAPTVNVTQPTCANANGTITITAPLGESLIYSIDGTNYQQAATFTAASGSYQVTVKNTAGCVSAATNAVVNAQPQTPATPTVNVTQPTCTNANGTITITAPLGESLTYSIDGTNYQQAATFTAASGSYQVTLKNADGCVSAATNAVVNPQPQTPAAPTVNVTQPTCANANGTITITAPLGESLIYSIDGTNYQQAATFTAASGSYQVTVKNADGCVSAATNAIVNPQPQTPAAPTVNVTQSTCANANGTITITAPLGESLTYSIDGTNYQQAATFTAASGSYQVTVKNTAGCVSAATNAVVNAQPQTPPAPTVNVTQPTCANANGTITITAPLGESLTYSIDGTNYQQAATFTAASGSYQVTVKNTAGCVSPATNAVVNPQPQTPAAPTVNVTQPTCANANGTITITAPLGESLTYSIDGTNYQQAATFTAASGSYQVTVKNADGCVSAATNAVMNPQPQTPAAPTVNVTQPTCANANGTITITSPLGESLTYSIDGTNYQQAATFTAASGSYQVTVKNTAGCVSAATNAVVNPQPQTPAAPTVNVTQPTCANANGTITITAPLGENLTYSIDGTNYQQAATFTTASGSYQVTVKNTDGCVSAATNAVVNPQPQTPAAPTVNVTQPTCANANGTITITAPLGESLTYSIDGTNYQQAATFTGASGSYQVTVKNTAGCVSAVTNSVVNAQPQTPAAPTVNVTQPTCT